ncbi:hypothetical protein D9M71_345650 [compost metagenome]
MGVVQRLTGAGGEGGFALVTRRGGGDDAGTEQPGDLDPRLSQATGRAEYQHGFPGLEVGAVAKCMECRGVVGPERRRQIEIQALRQRDQALRRDHRKFGEGTTQRGGRDPLTDLDTCYLRPKRIDHPGKFTSGNERSRRFDLVAPRAQQPVGKADTRTCDSHAHFAGARLGQGDGFDPVTVERIQIAADDRLHGSVHAQSSFLLSLSGGCLSRPDHNDGRCHAAGHGGFARDWDRIAMAGRGHRAAGPEWTQFVHNCCC